MQTHADLIDLFQATVYNCEHTQPDALDRHAAGSETQPGTPVQRRASTAVALSATART